MIVLKGSLTPEQTDRMIEDLLKSRTPHTLVIPGNQEPKCIFLSSDFIHSLTLLRNKMKETLANVQEFRGKAKHSEDAVSKRLFWDLAFMHLYKAIDYKQAISFLQDATR